MQGSTVASTSSGRPAFIFSYNPTDPDLPTRELATTVATAPAPLRHSYSRSKKADDGDEDDDWVPVYGPTTYRRGHIKFVPAKDPQFAMLQGTTGEVGFSIEGKGTVGRQDFRAGETTTTTNGKGPAPVQGSEIRNLYASIVGLGASTTGAAATRSAPESRRESPPPARFPIPSPDSPRKRPRTVSPPPAPPSKSATKLVSRVGASRFSPRAHPTLVQEADERADIVLSSDDEDDDDLVIIDPLTGQPEPRAPQLTAAAQPLLIHQLLPTATEAREKPFVPPLQYGIKSDSPGWRLLARQGWKEGAPLGPVPVAESTLLSGATGEETIAAAAAARHDDRLKVPLRAVEKRDRAGIGLTSSSSAATATGLQNKLVVGALGTDLSRRAREDRERERRKVERALQDKRGKGERGMERMRKKEERERKAWIAYMNR